MKRRDFIKKAGVGVAVIAATTVNAPFVHAAKKKPVDFALDIYQLGQMGPEQKKIRDRLATGWKKAIESNNPAEEVYMLFRLEGYDATYEECLKVVETYQNLEENPPWIEGGPVAY
jgi:hypothetical protein